MLNRKGFTLIELLVVIGVLAVIAAGVVALINPADKLNQANDAKVQNDIGQLATASQSYAAQQASGSYPTSINQVVTAGELTVAPVPPAGYTPATYGFVAVDSSGGACTGLAGDACTSVVVTGTLRSLKYTSVTTPVWMWCSATGRAGAVATTTSTCP